jgi:hypothetical protein
MATSPANPKCGTCRFFERDEHSCWSGGCHRRAPTGPGGFPKMSEDEWCGEHVPAVEDEPGSGPYRY